jgi:hypothetical protein
LVEPGRGNDSLQGAAILRPRRHASRARESGRRREIRLARQEGKTVSPVKGPALGELGQLPRWLGQVFDLDLSEHFTTLIRVKDQSRQKRVPMMAPEPPLGSTRRTNNEQ